MSGPLAGIRIVEFVGLGPAPFAAMLLADMGADILRIDRPGVPRKVADPVTGRGRPIVEVDLKEPGSVEKVLRLIDQADALIEGFRPGVMERLGLSPETALARNPRLVYGRMTGWGQSGPLAPYSGHDINYIAISGALAAIGPADRPVPPLNLVGDYGGGSLYLVSGLLAGIISASRTGKGQVVDCAMCDGAVSLMSFFVEMAADRQWVHRRESNMLDGGAPYYGVYRCADGLDLAIGAIEPQFFGELCRRIGVDGSVFAGRLDPAEWPELRRRMAELIALRPRAEWVGLLEASDACASPVLTLEEAPSHPHLAARQSFIELDGLTQPAPAPRFSGTPSAIRSGAGKVGLEEAIAAWTKP